MQSELACNSSILQTDINSSIDSSYAWSNLIRGRYQFSVVAFTRKGPGDAVRFMLSILPATDNGMLLTNGYKIAS